jgi:bacillopeptidase F (M6 metalloprotease family)
MNQGVCSWETMPYSDDNGCNLLPNTTQSTEANNFRINSFAQVSLSDQTAIKTLLSQNHPLIAGTSIDDNFTNATAGMIWNTFNGVYGSNHGYVICGYDDSRHAYKVINSWGTSWGDNGYTWIDYDFFGTLPGTLYVITSAN